MIYIISDVKIIRPLDLIIIIFFSLLVVFFSLSLYSANAHPSHVVIQGSESTWIYTMEDDIKITINGPLGHTLVSIGQGRAQILSSPCTLQSCISFGSIHRNGQWLACLPNRVFLFIEGIEEEGTIDALVY